MKAEGRKGDPLYARATPFGNREVISAVEY
jgi:hypothetical protein